MSLICDESKLPRGEACSHYLADGDSDLPEGFAVSVLAWFAVALFAVLACWWIVATVMEAFA